MLTQKLRCYLVMVPDTFSDTTFHAACNNFKVWHAPPDGEIFDMIEARDRVKDALEAEVLEHQGDREAVTSDNFASSGLPDVAYAAGRSRPAMNTDDLEALRAQGVQVDDDNDPAPENAGGGETSAMIDPQIYPT